MIRNKHHQQLLKKLKDLNGSGDKKNRQWLQNYLGTQRPTKTIKSIEIKKIAKEFLKENNLDLKELINLLDSLYSQATTFEEIDLAARLLNFSKLTYQIDPKNLDKWLGYTSGWAEIDLLCQSNFESQQLLSNWSQWQKILKEFNKSPQISKRRASLVLLIKSLSQLNDSRLFNLAIKNIENLKSESEILITKAVSWLLRSSIKHHPQEIKKYLDKNKESLPKIAYRETLRKLNTGKK